jgi:hypothetical protein
MKIFNRKNLYDIWNMRNLSVESFLSSISEHLDLKVLLTVFGCWWLMRTVLVLTILVNVIYYLSRIIHLVLA